MHKKYSCRSRRTKNANSDSRQTISIRRAFLHSYRRNLRFYQIRSMNEKGYNIPLAKTLFDFVFYSLDNYFITLNLKNQYFHINKKRSRFLCSSQNMYIPLIFAIFRQKFFFENRPQTHYL